MIIIIIITRRRRKRRNTWPVKYRQLQAIQLSHSSRIRLYDHLARIKQSIHDLDCIFIYYEFKLPKYDDSKTRLMVCQAVWILSENPPLKSCCNMVSISQTYHGPNDLRRTNCIIKHRAHIIRVKVDLAVHVVEMSFRIPRMRLGWML
jgi:hypothetical protein